MWPTFARRACDIRAHVRCMCVCVCVQSVAARVKRSKVWAHVTKLSNTSVRCNICSSVIVNKGGNTSNIMKHLLTKHNIYLKQCAAFTMSPLARHIHIKCWFSGRVTLTRHCAYSQSQKYIICVYFKALPVKPFIRVLFWSALFQSACTWSVRTLKGRSNTTWLLGYLSYRLIALILSKTHKVYIKTQLVMSKVKVNSWERNRCVQVLKGQN